MVEANDPVEDFEQEEQKTFVDEPAILDKFKAAAVITDGKSKASSAVAECAFASLPGQG